MNPFERSRAPTVGSGIQRRALLGSALLALAAGVGAQDAYPSRPITLIVPYSAGGSTDLLARVVAKQLGQILGTSVVVENRGGAGSTLGTAMGARAKADGYTLVVSNSAAIITGPLLGQRVTYDPDADFNHILLLGTLPNGLIVRKDNPAKDLKEFLENARRAGGKLNYGSAGVGSVGFLTGEMLKQKANIQMTHIPYKGTGPAMNDLVGGQIDVLFNNLGVASTQVKAGYARILAVSSRKRMPDFPDVQTLDEAVPGVVGETWFGISGPKGMPADVNQKLRTALTAMIQDQDVRKQLSELGLVPSGISGQEFAKFLASERERWKAVITPLGITLE